MKKILLLQFVLCLSVSLPGQVCTPLGTGSFDAEVILTSAEGESYFTALGDLDNDGFLDLAVCNYSGTTVSVFRNAATAGQITAASFPDRLDLTSGARPSGVAIEDLDGDSRPEIVVTNQNSNTITIYRNTGSLGNLSFEDPIELFATVGPSGVAVADLDLDGKKDLAIANNGGNSSSGGNSISVFRNVSITGVILFEPKVDYYTGNNPLGVNIADLNGDHKPEIVTANGNSNTISILVNSTIPGILDFNSFFQKVDLPTPSGPINRVSIGDVNGDGKPDLAVVNLHGSSVSVFQNMILPSQFDSLSFSNRIDLPTANRPVGNEMSDLDRDGDLDLVVVHEATNTFNIYPNNGIPGSISESSFDPAIVLNKTGYSYVVSIGDLNNDGRAELVIGQGSNQVSIFPNIHPGNSAPVIHSIDLPEGAVKVNTPATIDVQFSDEGPVNAVVDWGDQSTSTFTNAQSILSASHEYQSAGLYPITVVLHDGCGLSSSSTAEYIVCFDPNGGFVAGTGWIRSPAGAYAPDPLLEGRANFLLAARYPNNWAMTPSGYTAFLFRAGNFVFSGSSLQWLVISDYKAQISGMGKVNGQGSYSFILTGIDGNKKEPQEDDRLRIKIRNLQTGMIIYDNHPGFSDLSDASTSLGAGNIFISSFSALNISGRISSDKEFATESTNGIVLYPNPAFSEAVIELPSDELISPITVEIKDKIGAFVRNEIFSGGTDKLTINVSDLPPGIYYCVVHTRNNTRTIRLAKE